MVAWKLAKRPVEPLFGLSILGYYRNLLVQDGGPCGREPTPSVNIKGSF